MFWNKNEEKKGLPDLPPYKPISTPIQSTMDEDDELEGPVEKHRLPSFPDSPIQKGFSQAAIKDAITTEDVKEAPEEEMRMIFPEDSSRSFKTVELDESPATQISNTKTIPLPPQSSLLPPVPEKPLSFKQEGTNNQISMIPKVEKTKEVYVKIDKFVSARRALQDIEQKVSEINELLKKIRDTKLREEQELSSWEKDILSLKSKLQQVTENIFERVE